MKKILSIILMIGCIFCLNLNVNAKTEDELLAYLSKSFTIAGKEVKLLDSDIVKVERYLSENNITDENVDKIIGKIDEIVAIMNKEGVSDPLKMNDAKRKEVLNLATEAATYAGASLSYDYTTKTVSIYKDGKLVDTASIKPYKLAQTGGSNTVYYLISGICLLAGSAYLYRKSKKSA